jgi:hypothetical protein
MLDVRKAFIVQKLYLVYNTESELINREYLEYALDPEFVNTWKSFTAKHKELKTLLDAIAPPPDEDDRQLSEDDMEIDISDTAQITDAELDLISEFYTLISSIVQELNLMVVDAQAIILQKQPLPPDFYMQITNHLRMYVGTPTDDRYTRTIQGRLLNLIPNPHTAVRRQELKIYNRECVLLTLLHENNVHLYNDTLHGNFILEHHVSATTSYTATMTRQQHRKTSKTKSIV